jgi:guanylate kinase
MAAKLFIISAPSGAGKTTLVEALLKNMQDHHPIERLVTYTTKDPRTGEQPGIDYHYITVNEFKQKIDSGFFLEYSTRYGAYYGSPVDALDKVKSGISIIIIIDRMGAKAISKIYPPAVCIWITPPSIEELQKRLELRNTENRSKIEDRVKLAVEELAEERNTPFYHYTVVNDSFSLAEEALRSIITAWIYQEPADIFDKK